MSSKRRTRQELIAALNQTMRDASGTGVLYSQAVAERLGINATDLECLDHIVTKGPITAGALAEATGLTTGAITGVVDRLERAGFAKREHDTEDRRKVLVRALPAVMKRIMPLFSPMERHALAALQTLGDDELASFLETMERMNDVSRKALKELLEIPKPRGRKTR
jgi:DNA-binding MarR family transcriptional regulator